ncbi:MAG: 50S ribosomal protein L20 [Deltaproteobacteria bacterium]|jgi:LSU ribosomal protein L20P|uniref:Large ribosomal subunit protein bL20 n=1 Tax=Candidatus Acidulodesulfobacterium acidiphilum TaxID=2597224 RepID=A0A520X8M3_9DELT|nr:50S ribosomal protein L20 [Deltaproteobacteria bacterium]MDA8299930.1 50S ribosomal protein L20 [Deltaproteobacteria bacterium]RZV37544.1 MAG: 50S ribosomal protein L20 [Candidatus Acidulodesulfobacterium acidiphilum]
MPRVKRGILTRKRHKRVLKAAKGYYGAKSRLFKSANEAVNRGLNYAYRDRKVKKREFRGMWIVRINAACRENGISYSKFINALNKKGIELNRKVLSEIALSDPSAFAGIVKDAVAA